MNSDKQRVHDFWNRASCGEELYLAEQDREGYRAQAAARYALEPYISDFAGFDETKGLRVLESSAGQRHRGALLTLARKVWPRGWIRRLLPNAGLFMLIDARK
jgi:hypothetical protein